MSTPVAGFLLILMTVLATVVAVLAYAGILRTRRTFWKRIFTTEQLPFLFVGLAAGLIMAYIGLWAKETGENDLREAVRNFEIDCDDQLGVLLHYDAGAVVDQLAQTNAVTRELLLQQAKLLGMDEITLADSNGVVTVSTDPAVGPGTRFDWSRPEHRPYRDLAEGRRAYVKERFRPSAISPNLVAKYFAMALPNGGLVQTGYSWQTFEGDFARYFIPMFDGRHVGETGFFLVFDPDGRVVNPVYGHPEAEGRTIDDLGLAARARKHPVGEIFRMRLFGEWCRVLEYESIAGHRLFAVEPVWETQGPALFLSLLVTVILIALSVAFRLVLGNFRRAQARIDALRARDEARRAADLKLARAIQQSELRTDERTGDGYRLHALMNPAREVGGDFYDYYHMADGRLVVTVADVSGKGVPAAFFMLKAKAALRAYVYVMPDDFAGAIAGVNAELCAHNTAEMFVTAWIGIYDAASGTLESISAGHNPPLVKRTGGAVEWVSNPRGPALGVFETARYRTARTVLRPGDMLFLYTDGVTEAMDATGALFGDVRLEQALAAASTHVVPDVAMAVADFSAGAEQADDLTIFTLEVPERNHT